MLTSYNFGAPQTGVAFQWASLNGDPIGVRNPSDISAAGGGLYLAITERPPGGIYVAWSCDDATRNGFDEPIEGTAPVTQTTTTVGALPDKPVPLYESPRATPGRTGISSRLIAPSRVAVPANYWYRRLILRFQRMMCLIHSTGTTAVNVASVSDQSTVIRGAQPLARKVTLINSGATAIIMEGGHIIGVLSSEQELVLSRGGKLSLTARCLTNGTHTDIHCMTYTRGECQ